MKKYVYFVSYAHGKDNTFGYGHAEVPLAWRIDSIDSIHEIQTALKEKEQERGGTLNQPLILFFKLLRVEDD